VGPRPATRIPPSGKLSWLPCGTRKLRRQPRSYRVCPSSRSNCAAPDTGAKHGVSAWPAAPRGLSLDCSNEALPPIRWSAGLPQFVACGRIRCCAAGQVWDPTVRRSRSKLRLYYCGGPGVAGSMSGIASRPASLHRRRLRGGDAASPWPVVARLAIPLSGMAVLRRPCSAAREIAFARSARFQLVHCWTIRMRRKPLSLRFHLVQPAACAADRS